MKREVLLVFFIITVIASSLFFSSFVFAADTTPPSSPGTPIEGSSLIDYDFDADGSYPIYWPVATDAQSGISAYEIQERMGPSGNWITLTSARTSPNYSVSGRVDKKNYFYRVRAKNGAGLWGSFSAASDGILIDKTAPTQGAVTDDGVWAASISSLRAVWAAATDAESGIAQYEYIIRRDSSTGTIVVNTTSAGLNLQITRTGLTLVQGKKYFIGVRAKNQAGLYSAVLYSDGIMIDKNGPILGVVTPADGTTYTEGDLVRVSVPAVDADGDTLQYQFLLDGFVKQAWGSSSIWTWNTAGILREHQITIQVRDPYARQAEQILKLFGYRKTKATP